MALQLRPRWVYDDGEPVTLELRLPQRPWLPGTGTVGGSDVSAAGVPSAFLIRRDHTWSLTLRFFESEWPSIERLVAHLQGGSSATWYPDAGQDETRTVYGVTPAMGDPVTPRRGDDPGTLELDLVIRRTTTAVVRDRFFDRALFRYKAGDDLRDATFARSGTVGPYTDADGLLKALAADIPRIDWEYAPGELRPSLPGLLLESPAFTNLVSDEDLTNWSKTGPPDVTGGIDDPAGGTGAYTITDDAGGSAEYISGTVPYTGSDGWAAWLVRPRTFPSSGSQAVGLYDDSAGPTGLIFANIDAWSVLTGPTLNVLAGTMWTRYVGNGYWAIIGVSDSIDSGHTNRMRFIPGNAGATGAYDAFRPLAGDGVSPPWSILGESEVKQAETLTHPWTHRPQAMCGIDDFRELERPNWATEGGSQRRIFEIGTGDTAGRLVLSRPSAADTYQILHQTAAGGPVTSTVDINPSWGDRVQLFWWLDEDGKVNIAGRKQALGATAWSAITTGTQSSAVDLPPEWSGPLLHAGSIGSVGRGSMKLYNRVIMPGASLSTDALLAELGR